MGFSVEGRPAGEGRMDFPALFTRLAARPPMTAVIVASRREVAPFGLAGGRSGAPGRQWVERAGGAVEPLSGTAQAELLPGDAFVIETPGGGGYGARPDPKAT